MLAIPRAYTIEAVAADVVPAMLAPGDNRWKLAARARHARAL